jgi:hypothetical protein
MSVATWSKTDASINDVFAEALNTRELWRIEKFLDDGVHAVIVNTAQTTDRRKTISIWALLNTRFYIRRPA